MTSEVTYRSFTPDIQVRSGGDGEPSPVSRFRTASLSGLTTHSPSSSLAVRSLIS